MTTLILVGSGIVLITISIILHVRDIKLSSQNTSIVILGFALMITGILRPKIIKVGDIELEIQNLKENVKPFAIVDLKKKKIIYNTAKSTKIEVTDINVGTEEGSLTVILSQKPDFFNAYFNGIWKAHPKFYREQQLADGRYKISIDYLKFAVSESPVEPSQIKDPEKMIIEVIGPGDLYN